MSHKGRKWVDGEIGGRVTVTHRDVLDGVVH